MRYWPGSRGAVAVRDPFAGWVSRVSHRRSVSRVPITIAAAVPRFGRLIVLSVPVLSYGLTIASKSPIGIMMAG